MRLPRAIGVSLRLGSLMFLATGCWTWTPTSVSPAQVVASRPVDVRVWAQGDSVPRLIGAPEIRNDTLFGLIEGSAPPGHPLAHAAIPVVAVERMEVWSYSHRRTLAVATLPALLSAYAVFLVAF